MLYDVAIIGAGTMGSAAAYHLTKRGKRVIVFEKFHVVHDSGSHSGRTRIIRHAYFESPDYVPLVLRADQLWQEIESITGTRLLIRTGGLDMGLPDSTLVAGAIRACKEHRLKYEVVDAKEIRKRWPQFKIPDSWVACYDPQAGFLLVDRCIRSHVDLATEAGAVVKENEEIRSFHPVESGITLQTSSGKYTAARAIVCAGAWTEHLLKELQLPLVVKRKALAWFRPKDPNQFTPERFPVFLAELPEGVLYGFPLHDSFTVKIANHHTYGDAVDPDHVDRNFHENDVAEVKTFVRNFLPALTDEIEEGKICLYTLTPDTDFILDFHPEFRNVILAAGFSGHGFKFATVIGEILADLAIDGSTRHPISRFRIDRF